MKGYGKAVKEKIYGYDGRFRDVWDYLNANVGMKCMSSEYESTYRGLMRLMALRHCIISVSRSVIVSAGSVSRYVATRRVCLVLSSGIDVCCAVDIPSMTPAALPFVRRLWPVSSLRKLNVTSSLNIFSWMKCDMLKHPFIFCFYYILHNNAVGNVLIFI